MVKDNHNRWYSAAALTTIYSIKGRIMQNRAVKPVYVNLNVLTAAATAGTDIIANDRNSVSAEPRVLRQGGLAGSVAINDFWVEIYVGDRYVGRLYNTKAAGAQIDFNADMRPFGNVYVPPGAKVSAIAGVNAGAGNVDILLA